MSLAGRMAPCANREQQAVVAVATEIAETRLPTHQAA
jgi:hypothetical protein